jgi:hypothetical protein
MGEGNMLTGLLSPRVQLHREFCKTLKILFFILAVVAPFFTWGMEWYRPIGCRCVLNDDQLNGLMRGRGAPSMSIDPNYYVSCCNYYREAAVHEVAETWERIRPRLVGNVKRWREIKNEGMSFSILLRLSECSHESSALCHEMAMAHIDIGWKYRCVSPDVRSWCGCGMYFRATEPLLEKEKREELEFYHSRIENLEQWEEKVTNRLVEVYDQCLHKHKNLDTLYDYGLLCQYEGDYQKSANLISEYISTSKEQNKQSSLKSEDYLRVIGHGG